MVRYPCKSEAKSLIGIVRTSCLIWERFIHQRVSGKQLSAELGVKYGTRAAVISAPEYHPVQSVAPEITYIRVLANHLSQVFDFNEVLWSCDGHHERLFAGVDAT